MDELIRDGRSIRYVASGAGPAMVLVHGWCGDHSAFAPQLAHFASTHRVVVPDLRGHGASDPADAYDIADFADDILWLSRRLELDRPVVVGHSMGGMVAIEAAAAHPDVFLAAVALDSPLVDDPILASGVDYQLELLGGARREQEGPVFLRAALWGPYDDHDRATEIIAAIMHTAPEVGLRSLAGLKAWLPRRRLLDCRQPVLCVHIRGGGPTDPTTLAVDRPNVMVAQTVGAGHFIQLEVPDQVNAMIERFLTVTAVHS